MKNAIIISAIALMVLFSGCTNQPAEKTDNKDTTKATVTTQSSGGVSGLSELFDLFRSRPKQYTITYDVITKDDKGEIKQEMTQYVASDVKMRMDMSGTFEGKPAESRIFVLGKDTVMCGKEEGVWSCMKFTSEEDTSQTPEEAMDEIEENIQSSSVTRIGDRVIAGMNSKCYSLKMTMKETDEAARLGELGLDSWEGIYCVASDGTVLYSESKSDGTEYIMEAKSYRPSVSESDFVPPAEPTSMEDLLGGLEIPETGGDLTDVTMPAGYEDLMDPPEENE